MNWLRRNRTVMMRSTLLAVLAALFVIGAWQPNHQRWPFRRANVAENFSFSRSVPVLDFMVESDPSFRFGPPVTSAAEAVAAARRACAGTVDARALNTPLRAISTGTVWMVSSNAKTDSPEIAVFLRADGRGHPTCLQNASNRS